MNLQKHFQTYVNFIHNSRQTGTYQFVFLKSLFYLAGHNNPKPDISWGAHWIKKNKKSLRVDLNFFAVLFIKYYWDMLYKFRLRQTASRNQYGDDDINIHKNFKDANGNVKKPPKKLADLADTRYDPLRDNVIYGNPTRHIKSSFGEVLYALDPYGFFKARHPRTRTTNLRTMDPFLEFDIQVPNFFQKYAYQSILEHAINYMLTRYLEEINPYFPQVAKAVLVEIPRGSLRPKEKVEYNKLYRESGVFECFYCHCKKQVKSGEPARDHVIPFDFVLNDELYNSVPSCKSCNSTKSNKLPDSKIFDDVIERNKMITNKPDYTEKDFRKLYKHCKDVYHGNRPLFHYQRCIP